MQTWKKIVRLLILVVILIPAAAFIVVQIPAVQTAAVGRATQLLTGFLDGQVKVGKVYFSYPNNLILKDVTIIQGETDTVAHLGKLLIDVKTSSLLFSKEARIRRISLEDSRFDIRHIDDSTTNLTALLTPLLNRDKDTDKESGGLPWESIQLDRLTLKRIEASLDRPPYAVHDLNFTMRKIRYSDGPVFSARLDNLTLREEQGLAVQQFGADVSLDTTGLEVRNLRYDDNWSSLQAERLSLGFSDFSDFSGFTDKVKLSATLDKSFLDLRTVRYFVPASALQDRDLGLWIDGQVDGYVNNLNISRLQVQSASKGTLLALKGRVMGLPDLNRTRIWADISPLTTSTADLGAVLSGVIPGFKPQTINRYAPGETLTLKARADGYLSRLDVQGTLATQSMGAAAVDAILALNKHGMDVEGTASTESLELGRLLGSPALGPLTAKTDLHFASSPKKGFSVDIQPVEIKHFIFKDYDYHDITATGTFNDGRLQVDLMSSDPNINLQGRGDVILGGKGQDNRYRIDLDLKGADLDALHFDKREGMAVSLSLSADVTQTPQNAILGQVDIRSLRATVQDSLINVGDIAILSTQEDDRFAMTLTSSLARADYEGNIFLTDFLRHAYHVVLDDNVARLLGSKPDHSEDVPHPEDFGTMRLRTLDLQPVFDFFATDLFISRESNVSLNLLGDEVEGNVSSELIALKNNFLHNLQLRVATVGESLHAYVDADRFQTGGLLADNISVNAQADSTFVDMRAGFHNEDGSGNRADLHAQFSFHEQQLDEEEYLMRADILPSTLTIAEQTWELEPATIHYRDKHIRIDDFSMQNGQQGLYASGIVSENPADTVVLNLNDFDMGLANAFLSTPLNLQGLLSGRGEAFGVLGPEKGVLFDLDGNMISVAGHDVGDLKVQSHWDDEAKRFNFLARNTLGKRQPLLATAFLHPSDKKIGADVQVDSLQLGFLDPLLEGLASHINGSVSGHLKASGPLDKISVSSEGTRFNDLRFRLDYTQVDYAADGPFSVGDKGVTFNNILIHDLPGHEAVLSGGVPYDHFKNLRLNFRIDLKETMALNTTLRDNETFYGKAFADGTVRVSGPLDNIRLSLNLTPKPNTTVHIPLSNSGKESKSLLTFVTHEEKVLGLLDSLLIAKQVHKVEKKKSKSKLGVNLRLNATPDAEIHLEIDKNTGDILKARGNGQIGITVDNENFDIKGDYRVDSGSYHFGMLGFTSRDFSIDPGGTIGFVGDVMQSDLNLTATYRTKASISPLIADSTAVSSRRTVDCSIGVSGKLANPEIKFNIAIPDLDPTTQSRVESALNTEDKRMKQALALLISGGFVPDEQSGIVNSTTMLASNASEMMASQLNNILRQLDIPIDLGFNYQPTENGRDIFDVAVSTQLFNNRVSINGNIGNRQYMSSSNSDIVGDLDIEIKLNREGQVRMTLFSHSADQYSNYLDQSQRNGAGIVYQEDFNTLRELWRKLLHIKTDERKTIPDPDAAGRVRPGRGAPPAGS